MNRRVVQALAGVVLALLALWLATLPFAGLAAEVFALRSPLLQGTGTLALGMMSVAMILLIRPLAIET